MPTSKEKTINLALQGGGSHGAFTWGVLDRLLEEENLKIEGISGTSGGALNAALLLQGYAQGGSLGAQKTLDNFWTRMGGLGVWGKLHRSPIDQLMGVWNIDSSPGVRMFDMMGRLFSPYQANPMNINPLRDLLESLLDIETIRNCAAFKLFVAATNVETGRMQVFPRSQISLDILMASACLPFTFQAVEIDNVPYWDGGYSANPALSPLIYHCSCSDIAIVQLIPFVRPGTPTALSEIINRLDEISFNSSLQSELRTIALAGKLFDSGALNPARASPYRRINVHMIEDLKEMTALGSASKMNTEMDFLVFLKKLGRAAADRWLATHGDKIGQESSYDLSGMLTENLNLRGSS